MNLEVVKKMVVIQMVATWVNMTLVTNLLLLHLHYWNQLQFKQAEEQAKSIYEKQVKSNHVLALLQLQVQNQLNAEHLRSSEQEIACLMSNKGEDTGSVKSKSGKPNDTSRG